jgi:GNAT superfamily N-acetyltransferase
MPDIAIHPVTPERWGDLEKLFGPSGAYGGCWCMFFRMRRKEFEKKKNLDNKAAMKAIVDSGKPPGLLAYIDGEPAGWCSLDPREKFAHLEHSRKLQRVDDQPVWSIVCFVIGKQYRKQGLMTELLQAAVEYAREHGAKIIEGYPIEPEGELGSYHGYTGIMSTYRRLGFEQAARPSKGQAIMRKRL